MTTHLVSLLDPFVPLTESATRAASVNASFTPRLRFAEHSDIISMTLVCDSYCILIPRYRSACILRATSKPWV